MKAFKRFAAGITKKQCMEFGQVGTLAAIVCALYFKNDQFVTLSLVLIIITIVFPIILYPVTFLWFGLSKLLSLISPVILLTIVFFLIVSPVGVFRRLLGKDSLKLKQFKKSKQSVMITKNHLYTETDLLHTF